MSGYTISLMGRDESILKSVHTDNVDEGFHKLEEFFRYLPLRIEGPCIQRSGLAEVYSTNWHWFKCSVVRDAT